MDMNTLLSQVILSAVPIVTMVLVWGVRAVLPKLPRVSIPVIAMLLGVLVSYLTNLAGGPAVSPLVAALLGAAATWLREIINTLKEHGTA